VTSSFPCLIDEQGGQREIVLGVDDELLAQAGSKGSSRRIPRDDVAALSVAALFSDAAKNRQVTDSIDQPHFMHNCNVCLPHVSCSISAAPNTLNLSCLITLVLHDGCCSDI
jgi:hypothetical protein